MNIFATAFIILVAILHIGFMWFEMFAWTTRGPKVFRGFSKEMFQETKSLAANQGLYNGFLAAGLIWSLLIQEPHWKFYVALFFLSCVVIAGIFGTFTASKRIFYIQALPALIAIILLHL